MVSKRPVRIQGAGPAGLSAAICLARAGQPVDVYEQHETVAKRFSGDLHGIENWSLPLDCGKELENFGIEQSFEFVPCTTLDISNGRAASSLDFARPIFYLVRRGSDAGCLDHGLLVQAQELGVQVHFNSRIDDASADILGSGPSPSDVFAIEKGILFKTDGPDISVALIHPEAAPGGYAYLLVHRGEGVLCSVLFDQFHYVGSALSVATQIFQRDYPMSMESIRPIGGIGALSLDRFGTRDGKRRVGEAAGLQDFLFGFGIRNAMVSGALAARSWLGESDHFDAQQFRFAEAMRCGPAARRLWARWAGPLFRPLVWCVARSRNPHALLARAHCENILYRLMS